MEHGDMDPRHGKDGFPCCTGTSLPVPEMDRLVELPLTVLRNSCSSILRRCSDRSGAEQRNFLARNC